MAYVSQDLKNRLSGNIKSVLKKYGMKGSLSVRHHSTLVLNLKSGPIDFIGNSNETCGKDFYQVSRGFRPNTGNYCQVNVYHYASHYSGKALDFLNEIIPLMHGPDYFDHTDAQIDYFHCSHYIDINIGKWDSPYVYGSAG